MDKKAENYQRYSQYLFSFLLGPLFFMPLGSLSQNLSGEWDWRNEKYEGTSLIDSDVMKTKIYFKDSDTKVLETFYYYVVDRNRIYLSENPIDIENLKSFDYYKFKQSDQNGFLIQGANGDEIYKKKGDVDGKVYPFKKDEIYRIDDKQKCLDQQGKPQPAGKCLSLAEVNFYMTYDEVVKKYGKPLSSIINADNSQTFIFRVNPKDKKPSKLDVTVKEDKIVRLKLSGYKSDDKASFSSIRLGDFYTMVKNRLGEPYYKKEVKAAGDETWVYTPIPITIEFKLNKVASITIEPFQL